MGWRAAARTAVALTLLAGAWVVVPVAMVELDEQSVPSTPTAASLPSGVDVVGEEDLCGSGGCWRELTLVWPGHSRDDIRQRLDLTGPLPQERCEPVSVLDRRRRCVGVHDLGFNKTPQDDQVRIYARWSRPLEL